MELISMLNKSKNYIIIWTLFFLIAIGLGYSTISRYSPADTINLDDSAVYSNLVVYGLDAMNADHRSSRILVPLIARPIFLFSEGLLGSWEPIQFSLLVVASFFCALTAILIIRICEVLYDDKIVGLIASFIFYANFAVPNLYLAGLVDSAECFFVLLLAYALLTKRWKYIPIIGFLGVLSKETFLPISVCFAGIWWLYDTISEKSINYVNLLIILVLCLVSSIAVVFLKSFALGEITMPWQYADSMESNFKFGFDRILAEIRRFSYVFIWLLPLAIFKYRKIPMAFLTSTVITLFLIFSMGVWAGVSGAAMARYMFSLSGPMLSIAAAFCLVELLNNTDEHVN
jgi:hypothetical protein